MPEAALALALARGDKMPNRLAFLTALLVLCGSGVGLHAQESRQFNRIATPQTQLLPPGARAVVRVRPIAAAQVELAMQAVALAWNTPQLEPLLAPNFYDKSRLLDALNSAYPRDAKLRILAVQSVQTLGQYMQSQAGGDEQMVSRVAVTVRTQVEFNDPRTGAQHLEGTNEYILLFTEPAP